MQVICILLHVLFHTHTNTHTLCIECKGGPAVRICAEPCRRLTLRRVLSGDSGHRTQDQRLDILTSSRQRVGDRAVDRAYLRTGIPALGLQLVDLGLGDVGPLLRLVHLMLQFAELPQVVVCLLLLRTHRSGALCVSNMYQRGRNTTSEAFTHLYLLPPRPSSCRI